MDYEQARFQIRTGDILACRGGGLFSKAISWLGGFRRWFLYGEWVPDRITHIGIAVWIDFGLSSCEPRLCVLEPRAFRGVRLAPLSHVLAEYQNCSGAMYWCAIKSEVNGSRVAAYAMRHWAKAYPSLWQFVVAASWIVQWLLRRAGRDLDTNGDRFHCSELATRSLMSAGYPHPVSPAVTTPQMVADFRCLRSPVLLELPVGGSPNGRRSRNSQRSSGG